MVIVFINISSKRMEVSSNGEGDLSMTISPFNIIHLVLSYNMYSQIIHIHHGGNVGGTGICRH